MYVFRSTFHPLLQCVWFYRMNFSHTYQKLFGVNHVNSSVFSGFVRTCSDCCFKSVWSTSFWKSATSSYNRYILICKHAWAILHSHFLVWSSLGTKAHAYKLLSKLPYTLLDSCTVCIDSSNFGGYKDKANNPNHSHWKIWSSRTAKAVWSAINIPFTNIHNFSCLPVSHAPNTRTVLWGMAHKTTELMFIAWVVGQPFNNYVYIPYKWKYWRAFNLAIWIQTGLSKILMEFNLVVLNTKLTIAE